MVAADGRPDDVTERAPRCSDCGSDGVTPYISLSGRFSHQVCGMCGGTGDAGDRDPELLGRSRAEREAQDAADAAAVAFTLRPPWP